MAAADRRLALRPLSLDDVDAVHAYRCLPEVVVHLSHDVLDRDQVRHRIAQRIERGRPGAAEPLLGLAVEELRTGRVVGDVMLRVEPSHSIAPDADRRVGGDDRLRAAP